MRRLPVSAPAETVWEGRPASSLQPGAAPSVGPPRASGEQRGAGRASEAPGGACSLGFSAEGGLRMSSVQGATDPRYP